MRIGLAQINSRIGDLEGNRERILAAYRVATRKGAEVVVFPEMVLTGYPPRDLLYDTQFVDRCALELDVLAVATAEGPPMVVGSPARSEQARPHHPCLNNLAAYLAGGTVAAVRAKQLLPAYDVFHEPRWFVAGPPTRPLEGGLGLLVCEDMWDEGYPIHPPRELLDQGAQLLICLSASPYRQEVAEERLRQARRHRCPLVFVNAVGGQDELVFDGGSFVVDGEGGVVAELPRFQECVEVVDLAGPARPVRAMSRERELFEALVLGVRDFFDKNGIRRAVLGLSGGIDSSLAACVAREALGPERVMGVAIPSRYTDPRSTEAARELARRLGIRFECVEFEPLHKAAESLLGAMVTEAVAENLQARLRMVILTAFVNAQGGLLLNTSNKTELGLGYGTLYGDLAGTLSPLGDLPKTTVYRLAHWLNRRRGFIPDFVLDRPPSAELRADQVDPFDYSLVAPAVENLVAGIPGTEDSLRRLYEKAEYKRRQGPLVLKVSNRAFGPGRMIPITRALAGKRVP